MADITNLSNEALSELYSTLFRRTPTGPSARADRWALVLADSTLCDQPWSITGEGIEANPLIDGKDPTPFQLKYLTFALGEAGNPDSARPALCARISEWTNANPTATFTVRRFAPEGRSEGNNESPPPPPPASTSVQPSPIMTALPPPAAIPPSDEDALFEEDSISARDLVLADFFDRESLPTSNLVIGTFVADPKQTHAWISLVIQRRATQLKHLRVDERAVRFAIVGDLAKVFQYPKRLLSHNEPLYDNPSADVVQALNNQSRTRLSDLSEIKSRAATNAIFALLKSCRPAFEQQHIEAFREALMDFTLHHSAKERLITLRDSVLETSSGACTWRQRVVLIPWERAAQELRQLGRTARLSSRNTQCKRPDNEKDPKRRKS